MKKMIPEKFGFCHQYTFFLHDLLVQIIKKGEPKGNFEINIEFDDENNFNEIEGLSGEELLEKLKELGFEKECDLLYLRQIFVAVLSDFLQFIYSALKASERGQLSVTYALLRKPLKDNMLILEWMLADPVDFLAKYKSENSYKALAIDKIPKEKKKHLIKAAREKLYLPSIPEEFIYELRYDKSKDYGFEPVWQQANHLITSCVHYKTEENNLNFVFSNSSQKEYQWETLYMLLPSLMYNAVQVIYVLYNSICPDEKLEMETLMRASVGYAISANMTSYDNKEYDEAILSIPLICPKCKSSFNVSKKIKESIIKNWRFKCPKGHRSDFFKI